MVNNQDGHNQNVNKDVISELWQQYSQDQGSVPPDWQQYFQACIAAQVWPAATATPANTDQVDAEIAADTISKTAIEAATQATAQAAGLEEAVQAAAQAAGPQELYRASSDKITESAIPHDTPADVTRSDLPPAPKVRIAAPTSPYVQRQRQLGLAPGMESHGESETRRLRGVAGAIVKNMVASLDIPTATTVRTIPVTVLLENREIINRHLARTRGGKISVTHLIAYAMVEALAANPAMNVRFILEDDKPVLVQNAHVGLGLAIDVEAKDGSRSLVVPGIDQADTLNFLEFIRAYQKLLDKAREGKLEAKDYQGVSATITNPGMIGTTHSIPRLMPDQGVILGVGAMGYPPEWAGAAPQARARAGIGKTITLTSTYDHRVIQGATSGEFLRVMEQKMLGTDGFYERIFDALRVPNEPLIWQEDVEYDPDTDKDKPARIFELIHAYRSRGHLAADTDPLEYRQRRHPDLSLTSYGLSIWDLDRTFSTGGFGGTNQATLRQILNQLRDTYTRTVGIEYMHIQDPMQRKWMQNKIEQPYTKLSAEERRHILKTLNNAEAFEAFLHTKYVGQKRFSLEGGESLIPALDRILNSAATDAMHEVCIGMAHRGRLNVLVNIAGKSYAQVFSEFEGNQDPGTVQGSGDVKYHLGTEGEYTSPNGYTTKVYLGANPSHLEAADGVLEGAVRAKQDLIGLGEKGYTVIPILIHGDSAFAGQGVVYETLNLSQLRGYRTGGTIHIIVNNQIGFTTGPASARSTRYCTDMAKGLQVPIFHVNGDDPENVVQATRLAYEFRQEFHKDVIIDMVCYRRRGHNEGDDPSMTQPVMYHLIDSKVSTRNIYVQSLVGRGDLTLEMADEVLHEYNSALEEILISTREFGYAPADQSISGLEIPEKQKPGSGMMIGWTSAVPKWMIERVGQAQVRAPEGFTVHPKLMKMLEGREKMSREGGIDWGMGEMIAYGSLLMEGTPIRISGQDARRGTFAHRHAVLHDFNTGEEWTPLQFLTADQANIEIYDSSLSEYAPLAFEYGYSLERPEALTMWEAQFGDFANGAQTVIDEFVCSAEQKWGQRSSLVMVLPHGYEGQGPDHSSARIERYLQLCAENNMRVVQPSTPANLCHLLRTQAYARPRKPLIMFSPKQLLRLRAAASSLEDITDGAFMPVIGEIDPQITADPTQVKRVLIATGRVYYDLLAHRIATGDNATAILRLEQLYPLPQEQLWAQLSKYPQAQVRWVQDEPANNGARYFLLSQWGAQWDGREVQWVSRAEAASPAAGTSIRHKQENQELMDASFAP